MSNSINELDNIRPTNPAKIEHFKEETKKELNAEQQKKTSDKPVKSHRIITFAECCESYKPSDFIIDDVIGTKSLHLFFGPPKQFKSFIITDIMCSIACPEIDSWHGKDIQHGDVVYFSYEGVEGIKKRLKGWSIDRGINPSNVRLFLDPTPFRLDSKNPEQDIQNTIANINMFTTKPALVVFDTLNKYMEGDENSAKDFGVFAENCGRIIDEFSTSVVIVTHTGNDAEKQHRARGSSSIGGALDFEYKISAETIYEGASYASPSIVARVTMWQMNNKDGQKIPPIVFDARQIVLPNIFYRNGRKVTTCVLDMNENLAEQQYQFELKKLLEKKEKPLPQGEKTARETYQKAAEKYGSIITDEKTGEEVIYTPTEKWREIFYENSSADNVKTRQKQFDRARKKLKEETHILTSTTKNGVDYYCLTIQNEMPADIRRYAEEIREAIKTRETENPSNRIGDLV